MPLFADLDGQAWSLIIAAIFVGLAGVLGSIGAIITGVLTLYLQWRREEAKIKREEAATAALNEVKTTLQTNTARTESKIDATAIRVDEKLDTIHGYVNSALQEAQRLYAEKCREAATASPTAMNVSEANRAESVYQAHRAQTEKMERDKRAAPTVYLLPQNPTGPITSAELKQDIAAVPVKVADEIDKRESPPSKESS